MEYKSAIESIMQKVKGSSSEPFITYIMQLAQQREVYCWRSLLRPAAVDHMRDICRFWQIGFFGVFADPLIFFLGEAYIVPGKLHICSICDKMYGRDKGGDAMFLPDTPGERNGDLQTNNGLPQSEPGKFDGITSPQMSSTALKMLLSRAIIVAFCVFSYFYYCLVLFFF